MNQRRLVELVGWIAFLVICAALSAQFLNAQALIPVVWGWLGGTAAFVKLYGRAVSTAYAMVFGLFAGAAEAIAMSGTFDPHRIHAGDLVVSEVDPENWAR